MRETNLFDFGRGRKENSTVIKTSMPPEQMEAVERLLKSPRFVLADSVGYGKTLTVLAAYDRIRASNIDCRLLVFANKNAVGNWVEQVGQHTDMSIVAGGSDNARVTYTRVVNEDPDVVVLTYPSLAPRKGADGEKVNGKYNELLIRMYEKRPGGMLLVLEEAHYVRNPGSNRHKFVAKIISVSTAVWAVTATPIKDNIEDIYHMMDLVIPHFFGTKEHFMRQYTVRQWKDVWNPYLKKQVKAPVVVGYQNLDQLSEKIRPYMIRRSREVAVRFEPVEALQHRDEEELYLVAAAGMIGMDTGIDDEEEAIRDFGARMPDLQRVVDGAIDTDRELRTEARLFAKEKALVNGLKQSFLQEGKAAVVFCFYNLTFQRLRDVLEQHAEYIGYSRLRTLSNENGTPEQRHEVAVSFDHGEVLLMTSVGKEAMNLRKVDEMWLYDIPDSAGDVIQVVGRMTRRDSEYNTFVVKVPVVKETVDTYKVAKLLARAAMIEKTVGGDETLPEGVLLSPDDLRYMRRELLWKVSRR